MHTLLDLTMLAGLDSHETLDGITWVWFQVPTKYHKRCVLGLRIFQGRASVCASDVPTAVLTPQYIAAWKRVEAFLAANTIELVSP